MYGHPRHQYCSKETEPLCLYIRNTNRSYIVIMQKNVVGISPNAGFLILGIFTVRYVDVPKQYNIMCPRLFVKKEHLSLQPPRVCVYQQPFKCHSSKSTCVNCLTNQNSFDLLAHALHIMTLYYTHTCHLLFIDVKQIVCRLQEDDVVVSFIC